MEVNITTYTCNASSAVSADYRFTNRRPTAFSEGEMTQLISPMAPVYPTELPVRHSRCAVP
jgi:hypothetical protein